MIHYNDPLLYLLALLFPSTIVVCGLFAFVGYTITIIFESDTLFDASIPRHRRLAKLFVDILAQNIHFWNISLQKFKPYKAWLGRETFGKNLAYYSILELNDIDLSRLTPFWVWLVIYLKIALYVFCKTGKWPLPFKD